jgi:processive 1,2-diacylglycerol beta-glucosyltransferase
LFEYTDDVDQLMGCATLIVTKPGGLTTAEALARGLPMVVVNPIPGQEANNTQFLLQHGVAVRARAPGDAVALIDSLLQHPTKLEQMRRAARALGKPDAASRTARLLLGEPA